MMFSLYHIDERAFMNTHLIWKYVMFISITFYSIFIWSWAISYYNLIYHVLGLSCLCFTLGSYLCILALCLLHFLCICEELWGILVLDSLLIVSKCFDYLCSFNIVPRWSAYPWKQIMILFSSFSDLWSYHSSGNVM